MIRLTGMLVCITIVASGFSVILSRQGRCFAKAVASPHPNLLPHTGKEDNEPPPRPSPATQGRELSFTGMSSILADESACCTDERVSKRVV